MSPNAEKELHRDEGVVEAMIPVEEGGEHQVFEKIMQKVGDSGPFQRRFNYLFNIGLVICASMVYMNLILALNVPNHWCHVPGREHANMSEELWKNLTLPR